jgi:glutamate racemase
VKTVANQSIGVFDSGHGGLTIQVKLAAAFPGLAFCYLGDHANAPYGGRTEAEVLALTRQGIEALFREGCRLVLLACNTAAAVALRRLQQEWLPRAYPHHRVLGVVVPAVEAITGVDWQQRHAAAEAGRPRTVAVFATSLTVASGAFPREIGLRAPWINMVQQPCPELAGAIERGASEAILTRLIAGYVAGCKAQLAGRRLDAALLGCTHYPLAAPLFRRHLPVNTALVAQSDLIAASLARYLERHPEFRAPGLGVRYLTTGNPVSVSEVASFFLGQTIRFETLRQAALLAG